MPLPAQEPFSREERRLALLAALLLPLRGTHAPPTRKKGAALPASSHIVREAIKWRTRDAEAVVEVHGAALELLRLHARLRVPLPRFQLLMGSMLLLSMDACGLWQAWTDVPSTMLTRYLCMPYTSILVRLNNVCTPACLALVALQKHPKL